MEIDTIENLALVSFFRRSQKHVREGGIAFDQPRRGGVEVDEERRRVVIRNSVRPLAAYTYTDFGDRVVFRPAAIEDTDNEG